MRQHYLLLIACLWILVPKSSHATDVQRPLRVAVHPEHSSALDLDLLRGFAKLHGMALEAVPETSSEAQFASVVQGRADLAAGGLEVGAPRSQGVAFSVEVFPTRLVVATRRPAKEISFIEGLRGTRIAVVKGSGATAALAAAKVSSAIVDELGSVEATLAALRDARAGAALIGLADGLRARQADPELQLGVFLGPRASLAYAARAADTQLLQALNEYLRQVRSTPSWGLLVAKSFGPGALEALARARLDQP